MSICTCAYHKDLEYASLAAFPTTGREGQLYVAKDTGKVYRYDTATSTYVEVSGGATTADLATKQDVVTPTSVKTANYTAAAGDLVLVDASGGNITITLPSTPADKAPVQIERLDSSANTVTVAAGGSAKFYTATGATTLTIPLQFSYGRFQYQATGALWHVQRSTPKVSLDLAYRGIDTAAPYPRKYKSGNYYYCHGYNAVGTIAQTNGQVRAAAWIVTESVTISKLFAEFTAAGEANSYIRPAVWADNGFGEPGLVAIDPGLTISTGTGNAGSVATGGTPGVYEVTLGTPVTLQPGLYWAGVATQNAPTTPPTIRTSSAVMPGCPPLGTALPASTLTGLGHLLTGQTGALTNNPSPGPGSGAATRLGFKVQ